MKTRTLFMQEDARSLADRAVRLEWKRETAGWRASAVAVRAGGRWIPVGTPSGEYTVLFATSKPDAKGVVANTAGEAFRFLPNVATARSGGVRFTGECEVASITADWTMDPDHAGDVLVTLTLTARRPGWYSLASPALTHIAPPDLAWGMIPGYWQGTGIQRDFELAFSYGQGIPARPVLARERTSTTLSPLLSARAGGELITLATIPEPGTGRDPWEKDKETHSTWKVGLSLMDRESRLTPTVYAPVLGEKGSQLEPGQTTTLRFRYTLRPGDWTGVYRHAVRDVYRFGSALALKRPERSLTDRLKRMHAYVTDAKASLWQVDTVAGGQSIGAQSYLGGVKTAQRGEAMKNSDLGALWMLARITDDPLLRDERLPLVRAFKLAQQETGEGFFRGAALGQYWLREQDRFVEEWGPYVEPMGLTYYTLIDMGNILLFSPNDTQLRERVRLGAETLLRWQKADGSWDVAYDRSTHALSYPRLTDLRPTWYGLYVAWRVLGDRRYLDAARRGADWFLARAVEPGHYLGVCGDTDFVMDFATGQSAQCLLDLYEATRDRRYREAALKTGRLYWTWTYTHPIPDRTTKTVKGKARQDWEITQAGLNMEHGGVRGSAIHAGPIQLCSHAGMFVRLHELTGDPLFLEMARHAALGRDAFVEEKSGVASYYWRTMDAGPGPYPHHAWWQVGWIMDYLLAEARLRSGGRIDFPRGFVTPKVGPQQSVGFAPGTVYGKKASLWMPPALLSADNPAVDTIGALAEDGKTLFVLVLSESTEPLETTVTVEAQYARRNDRNILLAGMRPLAGRVAPLGKAGTYRVSLGPYGIAVLAVSLESGANR
jgi:hypothetical protein